MLGFKDFASAQITLAGVELLHRIRQGQFDLKHLGVVGKTAPEIWDCGSRRINRYTIKTKPDLKFSTLHQSRDVILATLGYQDRVSLN